MKNVLIAVVVLLFTLSVSCATPKGIGGYASPPPVHQWTDPVDRMCFHNCRLPLQKVVDKTL